MMAPDIWDVLFLQSHSRLHVQPKLAGLGQSWFVIVSGWTQPSVAATVCDDHFTSLHAGQGVA